MRSDAVHRQPPDPGIADACQRRSTGHAGIAAFLPGSWTSKRARLERAGVPAEYRTARTKPEMALAEIDRAAADQGQGSATSARGRGLAHRRTQDVGREEILSRQPVLCSDKSLGRSRAPTCRSATPGPATTSRGRRDTRRVRRACKPPRR